MPTQTDYFTYANVANQGLSFANTLISGQINKKNIAQSYNSTQTQYKNNFNKLMVDFGASMSEVSLSATALYGMEKQLDQFKGVVNVGEKKDYGRPQRLQLLQQFDDTANQLALDNSYAYANAKAQQQAITQQQRVSALTSAMSMAIMFL